MDELEKKKNNTSLILQNGAGERHGLEKLEKKITSPFLQNRVQ